MIFWMILLFILEFATLASLYWHCTSDEVTMLIYCIILVSVFIVYRSTKLRGSGKIKKLEQQVRKLLAENDSLKERLTDKEKDEDSNRL